MLRHPFSKYVGGYSRFLYKHKVLLIKHSLSSLRAYVFPKGFDDAEALVVAKKSDNLYLCRMYVTLKLSLERNYLTCILQT
jgi:hypothetical protein